MGGDIFEHANTPAVAAWATAAARGAAEALGLFVSIEKFGAMTVGELAARLGVAPRRLSAVVDVLVLDGALVRQGERVALGDGRGAPTSPTASALVEVLRRDRALAADESLASHHAHLFSVGRAAAEALWAELGGEGALVDLGGGQGAYTAAWLDGTGGARRSATLVDRAPVLALARAALGERAGLRTVAADLVAGDPAIGEGHAVALLANVLHLLSPEDAARAVATAARAVRRDGGLVVVKDLYVEPDRRGPSLALLFSLTMALYSNGTVYDVPTLRAWLEAAGLVEVRVLTLAAAPDSVVVVGRRL